MKKVDICGQRFGRLIVLSESGRKSSKLTWLCKCDCGETAIIKGECLHSGHTKSCGCLHREKARARLLKHGHTDSNGNESPEFRSWMAMKARCENPNHKRWKDYGGRGISICKRWRDFRNFYADMGKRPEGLTLDRYPNNDGDYEPGNCRWATRLEQNRNQRRTRKK